MKFYQNPDGCYSAHVIGRSELVKFFTQHLCTLVIEGREQHDGLQTGVKDCHPLDGGRVYVDFDDPDKGWKTVCGVATYANVTAILNYNIGNVTDFPIAIHSPASEWELVNTYQVTYFGEYKKLKRLSEEFAAPLWKSVKNLGQTCPTVLYSVDFDTIATAMTLKFRTTSAIDIEPLRDKAKRLAIRFEVLESEEEMGNNPSLLLYSEFRRPVGVDLL